MDINKEQNDIEQILKGHKPKIVEKDFYDTLLNEEIGRISEAPEKDISVYVKIPMADLLRIKASIEAVNQGKIHDLPLLATDIINNLIDRYFSEEYIDAEDFVDLVVRDVDETVLATSGEPTSNIDVTPIKDESDLKKASLINASYYENGKYVEDMPLDVRELEDAEIMDADEQLTLSPREEDLGKIFYRAGKNVYAIKGEK